MSLVEMTAVELLRELESGAASAVEVAGAFLDQIERLDDRVGAFLEVSRERALDAARDVDQRRAAGEPVGALGGLPVAVKDLLCSAGQRCTCASRMLKDWVAPYDATVVKRLRQADAVLIGRTNLDEFAMGASTENSALAVTSNPWNLACIPGGSSGGAAACVAASMAPLSLGTDTGGSIRLPAALCGVTGMKPTYGRVSRYGLVAFASSLDQIGPLARTAEDAALLLEAIAGHDPHDSTSVPRPTPRYSESIRRPLDGLRIGVVPEHFGAGLTPEVASAVQAAIRTLETLGGEVREVALPHGKYGVAAYYLVSSSEASSNLARYDGAHYGYRCDEQSALRELAEERARLEAAGDAAGLAALDTPLVRMYRRSRAEGFGAEVKRRIMLGTYALSAGYYDAYYVKALKVRRLIRGDYDAAFEHVDVIAGPVSTSTAFRRGDRIDDPLAMYLVDLYTAGANLAGIPGISIPCGFSSTGLPIGLQLQAPPFEEERLLRAAHMFQQVTDWHARRPVLA